MIISQNPSNQNPENDAQYHYPGGPNQMVKVGHAGIANSASSLATICAARDMLAAAATPLTRWASLLGQQLLQVTVNRSCWVTTQSLTAAPISFD
jgi:hypothetical protein